jgi:hypothetical protein
VGEPSRHDLPSPTFGTNHRAVSRPLPTPTQRPPTPPLLVGDPAPTRPDTSRGEAASRPPIPSTGPARETSPGRRSLSRTRSPPENRPAGTPPEITVGDHHPNREAPQEIQAEKCEASARLAPAARVATGVHAMRRAAWVVAARTRELTAFSCGMSANQTAVRVGLYCRISDDLAGAGLGVDRQRSDCAGLAAALGWQVVDTYTDNDVSALFGAAPSRIRAAAGRCQVGPGLGGGGVASGPVEPVTTRAHSVKLCR